MKPKILLITSWYPNKDSPLNGIFVQEQATFLSTIYDVCILYIHVNSWKLLIKNGFNVHQNSQIEDHDNIKVIREFAFRLPRNFLLYHLYLHAAKRGFDKILNIWGKPDIIHAHVLLPGGWGASEIAKEYNIPVVMTEHSGTFSEEFAKIYLHPLGVIALKKMDNVIAVSPSLEQTIISYHSAINTTVIGNVIDTNFFTCSQRKEDNYKKKFLTISLLTKIKGVDFLLEAAHALLQQGYQSFELIIGGDGVERASLENKALKLDLSKQSRFLGLLSRSEVRYWMQQCDVFVMPSLLETFCIVIAEAMACGKPVISTYCGGPEFIVLPETGILVEPGNSISLAEAMEKFILEEIQYDADYIRQTIIDRFSPNAFIKNINAVYEPLLGKK